MSQASCLTTVYHIFCSGVIGYFIMITCIYMFLILCFQSLCFSVQIYILTLPYAYASLTLTGITLTLPMDYDNGS